MLTRRPPSSPGWHRRLRQRRSKARTALRQGKPLSKRQRHLRLIHHSTCSSLREKLHMGRREWQQEESEQGWCSYSGGPTQGWLHLLPGTGKQSSYAPQPRQPKNPKRQGKGKSKTAFPAYDADRKDQQGLVAIEETRHPKQPQARTLPQIVRRQSTRHADRMCGSTRSRTTSRSTIGSGSPMWWTCRRRIGRRRSDTRGQAATGEGAPRRSGGPTSGV